MDGMLYYGSLILLAIFAFIFNQSGNTKLVLMMVVIGIYLVYSHETGYTATDFRYDMVDSINDGAKDFVESNNIDSNKEAIK